MNRGRGRVKDVNICTYKFFKIKANSRGKHIDDLEVNGSEDTWCQEILN